MPDEGSIPIGSFGEHKAGEGKRAKFSATKGLIVHENVEEAWMRALQAARERGVLDPKRWTDDKIYAISHHLGANPAENNDL